VTGNVREPVGRNKRSALRRSAVLPASAPSYVAVMPNYRRAFVPGGRWFFTVNLLDRLAAFLVPSRRAGGTISGGLGGRTSANVFEMGRRNALRLLRPTRSTPANLWPRLEPLDRIGTSKQRSVHLQAQQAHVAWPARPMAAVVASNSGINSPLARP
jgi:hypothetical protein